MTTETDTPRCPECRKADLRPVRYDETIEYRGSPLNVTDLEGYECPACGADPVFPDQFRRNSARFTDARRSADGLLTGASIRKLREALGLTQAEAARLLGGGANAFSKYERGEVMQSEAMDRLMRVLAAFPWVLDWLRDLVNGRVEPNATEYGAGGPRSWVAVNDGTWARPFREGSLVEHDSDWRKAE